jgi:hypothetical protein
MGGICLRIHGTLLLLLLLLRPSISWQPFLAAVGSQRLSTWHTACSSKMDDALDDTNLHEDDSSPSTTSSSPSFDQHEETSNGLLPSRRAFCTWVGVSASSALLMSGMPDVATAAADPTALRTAVRPLAYRVDSTMPPTLLPLKTASAQKSILQNLGRGSGTDKQAIVVDTINLNNMLNKAVFGTVEWVSSTAGALTQGRVSGPGLPSFVCLGVPSSTTAIDIELAVQLLHTMVQVRPSSPTSLGLSWCPTSTQSALDQYIQQSSSSSDDTTTALQQALVQAGVSEATIQLYLPLLRFAKEQSLDVLALAPEPNDIAIVRAQGLQYLEPERRSQYVVDPQGFIASSQDPAFQLYADRSLFKDFVPLSDTDSGANYFAERILVHEAAATAMARYAVTRPTALVVSIAPISDVRFLGGINGRIPRIYQALSSSTTSMTSDRVTTILLNPTARETLSKSRFLRLEIGTGPDTLAYQTKVADYVWFSSTPPVNLIPRLMDG